MVGFGDCGGVLVSCLFLAGFELCLEDGAGGVQVKGPLPPQHLMTCSVRSEE